LPPNENDAKIRILIAAKKLFAKQGFDATSVRQICEEAGANIALISYYFGGKENVLIAIFEAFFPTNRLNEHASELVEPVKGLRVLIREIIALRWQDPELISILQQEIHLMSPRVESLQKLVFPVWRKFRELLEQGRAQGLYTFESLDNTMLFALGSIFVEKQRDYLRPLMEESDSSIEEIIRQTTNFIFNAINYQGEIW